MKRARQIILLITLSGCVHDRPTAPDRALAKDTRELEMRSAVWNTAFVRRDVKAFGDLLADDVQMASAGGQWNGRPACIRFFESLISRRPDIIFVIKRAAAAILSQWNSAYETGEWSETWT